MSHPTMGSRARILVRRVHLWLGLSIGLIFAVVALSGSALVFYTGIDAALNPVVQVGGDGPAPALDSAVRDIALATGRAQRGAGRKWTIEITGDGGAIPARFYPASGGHDAMEMLWFSADGSRIVRAEPWGGYLMSWVYQLHMELLAGEIGLQVVGWSGFAMLLLLASGIWAWWPRGSWRKALAFKRGAVPIRRLRDLHKLSGLWSMALLGVLVATGVLLALFDVTRALFAPAPVPAPTSHVVDAGGPKITIAQALATAQAAVPDGRMVFVDMPGTGDGAIRVRMQVPGDPHPRFPGSFVFLDQASGRVLAVHDIRAPATRTGLTRWIRTLHDGTIGGLATRILAVLLGCVPAVLFVTGLLHWLRRRAGARGRACAAFRSRGRRSRSAG